MKTRLALILGFFLMTQFALAQAHVAIGIKAGPNFATIDTKASAGENYKNRAGFHGGAFLLVKAAKFGIQPEIIFSQQGSKVSIDTRDFESNFTYVNIPVILKLYTVAGINIQAGPQFGFVSGGEAPIRDESGNYTVRNVKDRMKNSDLTLGLGLGWDLPFGLTLDARYNMGLSGIYEQAPPQQTGDAKNQVFQFSLGYKLFKFGK